MAKDVAARPKLQLARKRRRLQISQVWTVLKAAVDHAAQKARAKGRGLMMLALRLAT